MLAVGIAATSCESGDDTQLHGDYQPHLIMNHSLSSDERGVLQPCSFCGALNRVTFARVGQQGRCGTCKADLPALTVPVEISSLEGFASLIAQSPLPVVVDFWAPWCGPCQMMAPEFAKAAAQAAGQALWIKVNTDDQPEIAGQFRVQGIPAFALIKSGRLVAQSSGFQPAAQLLNWLRTH